MKATDKVRNVDPGNYAFISHMVQMKGRYDIRQLTSYITPFISHMVQMKASRLLTSICPISTLYPTWFRWKESFNISLLSLILFFISHMVQMKALFHSYLTSHLVFLYIPHGSDESNTPRFLPMVSEESLYPTWFRWKVKRSSLLPVGATTFISHMVQMKGACKSICSLCGNGFISHMVQMKARMSPQPVWLCSPLYPTWFRWKRKRKQQT